jgi:uncharacterized pyridoxal phosphate-containing UPF0001 family protein
VFIEVNVAGEAQKNGVRPEDIQPLIARIRAAGSLHLKGLMTMAPLSDDPESARPHFAGLAALLRVHGERGDLPDDARHLSMGMSQDFEVAVEEGATIVRIGSALFEGIGPHG